MKIWKRDEYWQKHENPPGIMPRDAHDFISIHKHMEPDRKTYEYVHVGYSLCSPLCLIEPTSGDRPSWETAVFRTKRDAEVFASKVAREHKLKAVVYCD